MKIGEFAKKAGVTVKTLLYYDEIGLLKPSKKSEAGYRIYEVEDLFKLQQITTLKYIGLSLEEIKEVLIKKNNDIESVIQFQRKALEDKKKHLEEVILIFEKAENQIKNNGFLEISQLINIIEITNIENITKERFNGASEKYLTDRLLMRGKSAELINKLAKPNACDVILDFGCGTGKQLIELSQSIKLGVGIDISEGRLKQARANSETLNNKNVAFYIGTFEKPEINIDLKELGVTKIISNYALHHVNTEYKIKAIEKMIELGGKSLKNIIIGDLMFFEDPAQFEDEFKAIGYGPPLDDPSKVEELIEVFLRYNFKVDIHKLHPLVGVIFAYK
jgi:DNA-binding transcriptional MerR regulator